MNSYYFMNGINKPIIFLGNRVSSNFLFHFLRSLLHLRVTFLPPTLQLETHSKATPTACIGFQSQCNTCAVGTGSLLGVFYVFSVSHLPGSRREEDKGGPVALDSVTRELPMLEARKPGDILKHTVYLGPWCLQGQFGHLTTL